MHISEEAKQMRSAADIWTKVKTILEGQLTQVSMETWFDEVEAVALEETRLVLCVPSEFKRSILRTRYIDKVENALMELFSFEVDVAFLSPAERQVYESAAPRATDSNPHAGYTFDRFVVGSTNKFAYAAAQNVADQPGGSYNPLFIHGQSGLGKTHLLHAIANRIRETHPDYRIVYIKSEDFVNELIGNIRRGVDMQEFRDKYRKVDLFLMDDVQFIAGKDTSEEELFHTFNTLYEQGKQIVFTSDRPPHEMLRLEQRLRTRFEQGLTADIKPPDYETRMAILKNKTVERGIALPDPILSYVAENITANVRQIEGVVNKIMAYQELEGTKLDMDTILRSIRDILQSREDFLPSADTIIQEVARFYDLDSSQIRGQGQSKELATARNVAIYIVREMTQLPLKQIGQEFGGRHHSTIMSSYERIEKLMKEQPELNEIIRDIMSAVNSAY